MLNREPNEITRRVRLTSTAASQLLRVLPPTSGDGLVQMQARLVHLWVQNMSAEAAPTVNFYDGTAIAANLKFAVQVGRGASASTTATTPHMNPIHWKKGELPVADGALQFVNTNSTGGSRVALSANATVEVIATYAIEK